MFLHFAYSHNHFMVYLTKEFTVLLFHQEAGNDKISLSMKVVNQDNGKDLDENLVITKYVVNTKMMVYCKVFVALGHFKLQYVLS